MLTETKNNRGNKKKTDRSQQFTTFKLFKIRWCEINCKVARNAVRYVLELSKSNKCSKDEVKM